MRLSIAFTINAPRRLASRANIPPEHPRSNTFNPDALNGFYNLQINGQQRRVRVSTSTFLLKLHDFNTMNYLYNHGFNQPPFTVPKPIAYLEDEQILFYEDAVGEKLSPIMSASH